MPLTLNSSGVAVADDTDSNIIYQGTWRREGGSGEFNSTTHGADAAGSTATFLFNGSSVAVYGTLGHEGIPVSSYNLDDASLVMFSAPEVQTAVHQILFYQSPGLLDGHHRLTITFLDGNGVYWLDYLLFVPSDPSTSTMTSTPHTTTPALTTAMMHTTSTPTTSNTSVGAQKNNVGAIAGGTIGGLLLFGVIVALFYLWRRQALRIQLLEGGSHRPRGMDPFPISQPRYLFDRPNPPASKTILSVPNDPTYPSQPLPHPGEQLATSRSYVQSSSEYPVYGGPASKTAHSYSGSRSDTRSNPDAGMIQSESRSRSNTGSNTGERHAGPIESSPYRYPTESLHSSPQGSPGVHRGFSSRNIGQPDNQSDIRVHEDGGTRIAGGPSQWERPFSISRDIPPAYGPY